VVAVSFLDGREEIHYSSHRLHGNLS